MAIPAGIIIAWPDTVVSIPAGWDRVTDFDEVHPKGTADSVNPDITGGALEHSHASPVHQHSVASHNHAYPSVTGITTPTKTYDDVIDGTPHGELASHTHAFFGGPSGNVSGDTNDQSATWQSTISDPSYLSVIWIESDGTPVGIPDGALCYFDDSIGQPGGWIQNIISKSRFLKGASPAGDGGATGGGGSHTHTADAHVHIQSHGPHSAGTTNLGCQTDDGDEPTGGPLVANPNGSCIHDHAIQFQTGASDTSSVASAITGGITLEPPFHTLQVIENDSGGNSSPGGIIVLWLGILASIPSGWKLCDGFEGTPDLRNKFIKAANILSEVGDTGGAVDHDHTDPTGHSHAYDHTHPVGTASEGGVMSSSSLNGGAGISATGTSHSHVAVSSAAANGGSGSAAQTVDNNVDSQPVFRTVAYLQFEGEPAGAGPLEY